MNNKKTNKLRQYRQGDLLIEECSEIIKNPKKSKSLTLALGEVTGHSHILECDQEFECEEFNLDVKDGRTAVFNVEKKASVKHQEHGLIEFRPNIMHRVIRQREYSPAAIRSVQD